MPPLRPPCSHPDISSSASPHALSARYRPFSLSQLATAAGLGKGEEYPPKHLFPQPLILPEDDLAQDPKQPSQSFRSWLRCKDRNTITPDRQTVYVAAPPEISAEVGFMQPWLLPRISLAGSTNSPKAYAAPEDIESTLVYLSAFFYGLPVKELHNPPLTFTRWSSSSRNRIALSTPTNATLIRSRASPDHFFAGQLNLNDLIDAILPILPGDAYALLLLVNHDLYEEASDVFVCGRAYGASRVAVVSTARYNPVLDQKMGVDRFHAWPASHCMRYLEEMCKSQPQQQKQQQQDRALRPKPPKVTENGATPSNPIDLTGPSSQSIPQTSLHSALQATSATTLPSPTPQQLCHLWHARTAKTASHELLHCFALDHCVYHACVMQGSASLPEDARQPPYLCPVDIRKLARAVGSVYKAGNSVEGDGPRRQAEGENDEEGWMRERYTAIVRACEGLSRAGERAQQGRSSDTTSEMTGEREGGGCSPRSRPGLVTLWRSQEQKSECSGEEGLWL